MRSSEGPWALKKKYCWSPEALRGGEKREASRSHVRGRPRWLLTLVASHCWKSWDYDTSVFSHVFYFASCDFLLSTFPFLYHFSEDRVSPWGISRWVRLCFFLVLWVSCNLFTCLFFYDWVFGFLIHFFRWAIAITKYFFFPLLYCIFR